jgi:hypothetical protein
MGVFARRKTIKSLDYRNEFSLRTRSLLSDPQENSISIAFRRAHAPFVISRGAKRFRSWGTNTSISPKTLRAESPSVANVICLAQNVLHRRSGIPLGLRHASQDPGLEDAPEERITRTSA